MSFLESVQHGLEKASKEAARITKIQHLHNVANDLGFKATQEGQNLVIQAMGMYHNGLLAQGELVAICQQIATYQEQLKEVQEEIQRLQTTGEDEQPSEPAYPPAPAAQAYAPGTVPPAYPAYTTPPAGYPAYAAPAAPGNYAPYPGQPVPPQGNYPPYPNAYPQAAYPASSVSTEPPTKPGAPVPVADAQATPVSTEPPTKPGTPIPAPASQETPVAAEPPAKHTRKASHTEAAPAGSEPAPTSTVAPGTYAQGVLPPIFSPFTSHAPATNETPEAEAEPEHRAHHSTKKTEAAPAENAEEPPVKEKKAHKAAEPKAAESQS